MLPTRDELLTLDFGFIGEPFILTGKTESSMLSEEFSFLGEPFSSEVSPAQVQFVASLFFCHG